MQLLRQILVAVDASGESVKQAKALLNALSSTVSAVTLLHVVPTTQFTTSMMSGGGGDKQAEARRILGNASKILADIQNCTISERLEEGDPKTTVLRVAEEIDASLIVMGGAQHESFGLHPQKFG